MQLLFHKFHLIDFSAAHFPYFESNILQMCCVSVINVWVVLITSCWFFYRRISFSCLELMAIKQWVYTVISLVLCGKPLLLLLLLQYQNNGTMMVQWDGTWPHYDAGICVYGIYFSAASRPLCGVVVCHRGSEWGGPRFVVVNVGEIKQSLWLL